MHFLENIVIGDQIQLGFNGLEEASFGRMWQAYGKSKTGHTGPGTSSKRSAFFIFCVRGFPFLCYYYW